ncbi:MAG: pseudouridine synthase, partial [Anaerolineae bacterium]|nr:pseudouridine synthase [Anaerolineae bacterium]
LAQIRPQQANVGGVGRSGLVNPLEEEASGLVLAAKDEQSYRELRRHLTRQRVAYTYMVLVEGLLRGEGSIDEPIGNARHERQRLQVSREGRSAKTTYRAQRHFRSDGQPFSLLMVQPETSRRHQIRVHLAWYGFPIVGDSLYGSRQQPLLSDRLFLHLGVMEFPHPLSAELVHIESALPPALQSILTFFTRPKY